MVRRDLLMLVLALVLLLLRLPWPAMVTDARFPCCFTGF